LPPIPREQQAPYPRGQRAVSAHTVSDHQVDNSANAIRGPPRLWDRETTLAFFGGIDVSTLYRGMNAGRYPRPVLVSANVARWLADECEAALQRMIAMRDEPKLPTGRGRKRRRIT
jgi:predicted DNA-binding transcriptional regulator AlpA